MISFVLASTLALFIFISFYILVLEREKMFVFNRFYLLSTIGLAFVIPFLEFAKPIASQIPYELLTAGFDNMVATDIAPLNSTEISTIENQVQPPQVSASAGINLVMIVVGIYFLGFGIFMGRFVCQLLSMAKVIKTNEKLCHEEHTLVLMHLPIQPFAFWKFLFLSKESYENGLVEPEILKHELCHIRQKHTIDVLFIESLRVVFWFNPIFILYKRCIQLNHEYLADDSVVLGSADVLDYQRLLLSKVSVSLDSMTSFGSAFHFSQTRRRLRMIGKKSNPLRHRWCQIATSAFVVLVILGLTPAKNGNSWMPNSLTSLQSANSYEAIIEAATDPGNPYSLNLDRLDVMGLKRAFDQTPESERKNLTAFPFLDGLAFEKLISLKESDRAPMVRFIYHAPPEKKTIPQDIFDNWKNTKAIDLEIDGLEIETEELSSYRPADFALFEVRGIGETGFLKKKRYSVKLTTHAHFERIFVQQPKKLYEVSLFMSEEERYAVHYSLKLVRMNEETKELEEFRPKNFEASILHTFLIVEPNENQFTRSSVIYDVENQFPMMLEKGRLKLFSTYPTI